MKKKGVIIPTCCHFELPAKKISSINSRIAKMNSNRSNEVAVCSIEGCNSPDCQHIHSSPLLETNARPSQSTNSQTQCKYGASCADHKCGDDHPEDRPTPNPDNCKYFTKCNKPTCRLNHHASRVLPVKRQPPLCSKGENCKKSGCTYTHPKNRNTTPAPLLTRAETMARVAEYVDCLFGDCCTPTCFIDVVCYITSFLKETAPVFPANMSEKQSREIASKAIAAKFKLCESPESLEAFYDYVRNFGVRHGVKKTTSSRGRGGASRGRGGASRGRGGASRGRGGASRGRGGASRGRGGASHTCRYDGTCRYVRTTCKFEHPVQNAKIIANMAAITANAIAMKNERKRIRDAAAAKDASEL
jgi:hypothetical protein